MNITLKVNLSIKLGTSGLNRLFDHAIPISFCGPLKRVHEDNSSIEPPKKITVLSGIILIHFLL